MLSNFIINYKIDTNKSPLEKHMLHKANYNVNTMNSACVLVLRHLAYGVPLSTYLCRPSRTLHLFPTGCTTRNHDCLKFSPAGKNLRKVEFT